MSERRTLTKEDSEGVYFLEYKGHKELLLFQDRAVRWPSGVFASDEFDRFVVLSGPLLPKEAWEKESGIERLRMIEKAAKAHIDKMRGLGMNFAAETTLELWRAVAPEDFEKAAFVPPSKPEQRYCRVTREGDSFFGKCFWFTKSYCGWWWHPSFSGRDEDLIELDEKGNDIGHPNWGNSYEGQPISQEPLGSA